MQQSLIEQIKDGVIIEQDSMCAFVNQTIAKMTGYSVDELVGMPFLELFPSESRELVTQWMPSEIVPGFLETYIRCKDSSVKDVELVASLIQYNDQPATMWLVRDITRWKRMGVVLNHMKEELNFLKQRTTELNRDNEKLRYELTARELTTGIQTELSRQEPEATYAIMIEKAKDGVIIEQDGVYAFVNQAIAKMTGYTTEELIGIPFLELVAPKSRAQVAQTYKTRMSGKQVSSFQEIKLQCKDGTIKDVELAASLLQYQRRPAAMAIVRDITERKQLEKVLEQTKEALELRLDHRATELRQTNEQLRHEIAERKRAEEDLKIYAQALEESNKFKALFNDILSHDLRNLAAVVSTAVGMLLERETVPETIQLLTLIQTADSRILERIGMASKYSKLQDTKQIECSILDLNHILEDALFELTYQFEDKLISVNYLLDGEYPVWGHTMIVGVFLNLISNAIKYSPTGSRIELAIQDQGDRWVVSVKDFGEGIPDAYKSLIFTRFERLEKEGVKGTGLGLAITKRIIELHNGHIWVEDNPKGGSIFYVSLPKEDPVKR